MFHKSCSGCIVAFCKVGLGICYDLRFSEMAQIYASKGISRAASAVIASMFRDMQMYASGIDRL